MGQSRPPRAKFVKVAYKEHQDVIGTTGQLKHKLYAQPVLINSIC